MNDPDFSFWACTQAITDGPDDGPSSRENTNRVDDFGYIILNNMANNECHILKEGENTIGRHPLNHIYIEHPSVSMSHAVIQCDSDGVVLIDKGSLNKTRLNKKILKKNVAYFLDENALLIFGEVQANYFVETVLSETENIKVPNDTFVQKTTGNDGFSKSSDTIMTSNSSYVRETCNKITSDVSSVAGNSSTCKTETVFNIFAGCNNAKDSLNDLHSDLNSPSLSDEFLLDAISQIETNEIKVNSSEFLFPNKNTSSTVMTSTEPIPTAHNMLKKNNNIVSVSEVQGLCTEGIPEDTREDTPSPVMDLGPLIDYDDKLSVKKTNNYYIPNKITSNLNMDLTVSIPTEHVLRTYDNIPSMSDMQGLLTEVIPEVSREDTPSPVMDLGPLVDFENRLFVQKTDNHYTLPSNKSSNDVGELNENQLIVVKDNDSENCTQIHPSSNVSNVLCNQTNFNNINKSNMLNECTQLPVKDNDNQLQLTSKSINLNYNTLIEDEKSSDLEISKKNKNEFNNKNNFTSITTKSSTSQKENTNEHIQNIFDEDDDDIFISLDQKIESFEPPNKNKSEKSEIVYGFCGHSIRNPSTSTFSHSKTETEVQGKNLCKQNNKNFEADDDDIYNNCIQKESNINKLHESTKIIDKVLSNGPSLRKSGPVNEQETQPLPDLALQSKKTFISTSIPGSHSKNNDVDIKIDDEDFFNCPTQKLSISNTMIKMKQLSQSIHEQETQSLSDFHLSRIPSSSTSVTGSTSTKKSSNVEMNGDDFFNCPTQKLSISKKTNAIEKPALSIHELETQPLPDFHLEPRNTASNTSITGSTSTKKGSNVEMHDDDFFNCPTQKLSISEKTNAIEKPALSIHELETQPLPDFHLEPRNTASNTSITGSTSTKKGSNVEMHDDDFFNCPTQKLSISKKKNAIEKPALSIHELETQPLPDFHLEPRNTASSTSVTGSTSTKKSSNVEMNGDDFFNCPTQKLSISKKTNAIEKPALSIHELETQPLPDFHLEPRNTASNTSITGSTSTKKGSNVEMHDDDFFNCPTQKLSISKKTNAIEKPALSIHELETQPLPDFHLEPRNTASSTSVTGSTSTKKSSNVEMNGDDFFNCPTQKLSISKKTNAIEKPALSIHELETQPLPDFHLEPRNTASNTSITGSTSTKKGSNVEMHDDDFFNCPTQKLSISEKTNAIEKPALSIHELETQPLPDFHLEPRNTASNTSITGSTSTKKGSNVEMNDNDFFNCPTQELSISKKTNAIEKPALSIHELETQPLPDFHLEPRNTASNTSITGSTSTKKVSNVEMHDDDFFNCPTQKLSISEKTNAIEKPALSIHELETQPLPDFHLEPRNTASNTSITGSTSTKKGSNVEMHDDDFFNCPTQKLSISKKTNAIEKPALSIHELETQPLPDFHLEPRNTASNTSITESTSTKKGSNVEMNDNDFFNCPTQKLSISKKTNAIEKPALSIHELETQPLPDFHLEPRNTASNTSITGSTSTKKGSNVEMHDDDFFNCPTQKLSISEKTNAIEKPALSIHELETQPLPDFHLEPRNTASNTSITGSTSTKKGSNVEMHDDDFFNCPTQKLSISEKTNAIEKPALSIHELETQPLPDFHLKPRNTASNTSITESTSTKKGSNVEMNDDDFFNCPTQKLSISEKTNAIEKPALSIHELETQPLPDFHLEPRNTASNKSITGFTSTKKHSNLVIDDEDFFNCPTQKLNKVKKTSLSIHELETQPLPDFHLQPRNTASNTSITGSTSTKKGSNVEMNDDDFFNCPTQKLSISNTMIKMKQLSQSIHEQETQSLSDFHLSRITSSSTSVTGSNCNNNDVDLKIDDEDFFNCPTQKLSISKKRNEVKKTSLSIHELETQPLPDFHLEPRNTASNTSITGSTSTKKGSNVEMHDDDFFNCPTQKLSISKKTNAIEKPALSIHELETQPLPDFHLEPRNTASNTSITGSTSTKKGSNVEMHDDDFFNCPTQKLSISKKTNAIEKPALSIHELETQPLPDFHLEPRNTASNTSITGSTSTKKGSNVEMNDGDFFNCPTQKVSISKKTNAIEKPSLSIHELETQPLPDFHLEPRNTASNMSITGSTSTKKGSNVEMNDDDFFNCPTQKVSISKKTNAMEKPSLSIHELETQPLPDFHLQSKITTLSTSVTGSFSAKKHSNLVIDDEDFFNCPTQKLSISNTMIKMKQLSESIHEQETQPLPNLSPPYGKSLIGTSNTSISCKSVDLNSEIYENFYNHSTQPLPDNSEPCATISNSHATVMHNDLTLVSLNEKNRMNHTIQKSFPSTSNNKQNILNKNKIETHELLSEATSTEPITKSNVPSREKQYKENTFNSTTRKIPTKIKSNINKNETEEHSCGNDRRLCGTKSNCIPGKSKRFGSNNISNRHELSNQKQSSISNAKDMHMIRKSSRIQSISNNEPNFQMPTAHNENQNLIKNSKTNNKPIIYVRKDLHKTGSENLVSISGYINNAGKNNIKTSANIITVPQSCSIITSNIDNGLNMLPSIKQEPLADESEHQIEEVNFLGHKDHSKLKNGTIFSPSNEPSTSTNLSMKQCQNSTAIQCSVDLPNCQPTTSNDSSSQWKSFWNKKKMSCQNKEKNGYQKNNVMKKERYQTRANTKRDNSEELNRKRKQDSENIEESNKKMCKDDSEDRLNPPVQSTSDIVVTFSYLKSRNLLEMKHFVELTGGYVTDEITECNVLVTDKVRCSMKVLSAIAKGCPIVDPNWVKHSYTVKMFQDIDDFIITDKDAERKHKFKLKESLAKAKAKRLLEGYAVMVTPSVKPSPKDMKVIITCAGGNYVMNWPKKSHQKELIITCEQDRRRWKSIWDNNKAKIIDNDTFIMSIMRQKLII